MLQVPRIRQPNNATCFPACVWAVLTYAGNAIEYEEIEAACALDPLGAAPEVALQALADAGWDIEVQQEVSVEVIHAALEDERAPILILPVPGVDTTRFAHAVVACGLSEGVLTVMDPQMGDYRELPVATLEQMLLASEVSGFLIGRPYA